MNKYSKLKLNRLYETFFKSAMEILEPQGENESERAFYMENMLSKEDQNEIPISSEDVDSLTAKIKEETENIRNLQEQLENKDLEYSKLESSVNQIPTTDSDLNKRIEDLSLENIRLQEEIDEQVKLVKQFQDEAEKLQNDNKQLVLQLNSKQQNNEVINIPQIEDQKLLNILEEINQSAPTMENLVAFVEEELNLEKEGLFVTFEDYDNLQRQSDELKEIQNNKSVLSSSQRSFADTDTVKKMNKQLNNENLELNDEYQILEAENLTLKSKIAELQEINQKYENQINKKGFRKENTRQIELETRLGEQEVLIQELEEKVRSERNSRLSELRESQIEELSVEKKQNLREEIENLKKKLRKTEDDLLECEEERNLDKEEVNQLGQIISEVAAANKALFSEQSSLESECQEQKEWLSKILEEEQQYNSKMQEQNEEALVEELKQKEILINDLQGQIQTEKEKYLQEESNSENVITELSEELHKQNENQNANQELSGLKLDFDNVQRQLELKNQLCQNLSKELQDLTYNSEDLKQQVVSLKQSNANNQLKHDKLLHEKDEQNKELESMVQELRDELATSKIDENKSLQDRKTEENVHGSDPILEEARTLKQENESSRLRIQQLTSEIANLQSVIDNDQKEVASITQELLTQKSLSSEQFLLTQANEELESDNLREQREIQKLREQLKNAVSVEANNDEIVQKLSAFDEMQEVLKNAIRDNKQMKQQIVDQQERNELQQVQIQQYEAQLEASRASSSSLEECMADNQTLREQVGELEKKLSLQDAKCDDLPIIQQYLEKIAGLEQQNQQLQQKQEEDDSTMLRQQNSELNAKLAQLERSSEEDLSKIQLEHAQTIELLNMELDELKRQLLSQIERSRLSQSSLLHQEKMLDSLTLCGQTFENSRLINSFSSCCAINQELLEVKTQFSVVRMIVSQMDQFMELSFDNIQKQLVERINRRPAALEQDVAAMHRLAIEKLQSDVQDQRLQNQLLFFELQSSGKLKHDREMAEKNGQIKGLRISNLQLKEKILLLEKLLDEKQCAQPILAVEQQVTALRTQLAGMKSAIVPLILPAVQITLPGRQCMAVQAVCECTSASVQVDLLNGGSHSAALLAQQSAVRCIKEGVSLVRDMISAQVEEFAGIVGKSAEAILQRVVAVVSAASRPQPAESPEKEQADAHYLDELPAVSCTAQQYEQLLQQVVVLKRENARCQSELGAQVQNSLRLAEANTQLQHAARESDALMRQKLEELAQEIAQVGQLCRRISIDRSLNLPDDSAIAAVIAMVAGHTLQQERSQQHTSTGSQIEMLLNDKQIAEEALLALREELLDAKRQNTTLQSVYNITEEELRQKEWQLAEYEEVNGQNQQQNAYLNSELEYLTKSEVARAAQAPCNERSALGLSACEDGAPGSLNARESGEGFDLRKIALLSKKEQLSILTLAFSDNFSQLLLRRQRQKISSVVAQESSTLNRKISALRNSSLPDEQKQLAISQVIILLKLVLGE